MITCKFCSLEKPDSDFLKRVGLKCATCRAAYYKQWRIDNPERKAANDRAYALAHRERLNALSAVYKRKWRAENAERCREVDRAWAKANRPARMAAQWKWNAKNPEKHAANKSRHYIKNKEKILLYLHEYHQRTKAARRETSKKW